MTIKVTCPSCGKQLRVSDKHAGQRVKCPNCAALISVARTRAAPTPETMPPMPELPPNDEPFNDYFDDQSDVSELMPPGPLSPTTKLARNTAIEKKTAITTSRQLQLIGGIMLIVGVVAFIIGQSMYTSAVNTMIWGSDYTSAFNTMMWGSDKPPKQLFQDATFVKFAGLGVGALGAIIGWVSFLTAGSDHVS